MISSIVISQNKNIAKIILDDELGNEVIKIDIWVKGADDRFFDIRPTHTNVWAYANAEHSQVMLALCDAETNKPIEKLWDEKAKTPKGVKKLTKKEHDI